MMLEYEKVLSDCSVGGILGTEYLIYGRPDWYGVPEILYEGGVR